MKGKVTEELLNKMIEARKRGATYQEIESQFNVSRWVTIHYLRSINKDESVAKKLWEQAEQKSFSYLKGRGFYDLINLNKISPQSHFDILARKDDVWWLIDVTINENKNLAEKTIKLIDDFHCCVLYVSHDLKHFRLAELKLV